MSTNIKPLRSALSFVAVPEWLEYALKAAGETSPYALLNVKKLRSIISEQDLQNYISLQMLNQHTWTKLASADGIKPLHDVFETNELIKRGASQEVISDMSLPYSDERINNLLFMSSEPFECMYLSFNSLTDDTIAIRGHRLDDNNLLIPRQAKERDKLYTLLRERCSIEEIAKNTNFFAWYLSEQL